MLGERPLLSSWLLSFPSYFILTSANKGKNSDSGTRLSQLTTVSLQYLTFFFLFSRSSFEQVTVDKIQIRSRSFSSCNSFGGCRFGGASTGNDSLHHQQRLQFNLPVGYKKVSHPNLTSVEAHYAHVHHLAALSSNPVNKTETPINILVNLFPFN